MKDVQGAACTSREAESKCVSVSHCLLSSRSSVRLCPNLTPPLSRIIPLSLGGAPASGSRAQDAEMGPRQKGWASKPVAGSGSALLPSLASPQSLETFPTPSACSFPGNVMKLEEQKSDLERQLKTLTKQIKVRRGHGRGGTPSIILLEVSPLT